MPNNEVVEDRCARFEGRARKKRELACTVMDEAELMKLIEPDFTVSLRPSRAPLMIVDEEAIPGDYWKPQSAKLDPCVSRRCAALPPGRSCRRSRRGPARRIST